MIKVGDYFVTGNNTIYTITNVINSNTYQIEYFEAPGDFILDDDVIDKITDTKVVSFNYLMNYGKIIPKENAKNLEVLFKK